MAVVDLDSATVDELKTILNIDDISVANLLTIRHRHGRIATWTAFTKAVPTVSFNDFYALHKAGKVTSSITIMDRDFDVNNEVALSLVLMADQMEALSYVFASAEKDQKQDIRCNRHKLENVDVHRDASFAAADNKQLCDGSKDKIPSVQNVKCPKLAPIGLDLSYDKIPDCEAESQHLCIETIYEEPDIQVPQIEPKSICEEPAAQVPQVRCLLGSHLVGQVSQFADSDHPQHSLGICHQSPSPMPYSHSNDKGNDARYFLPLRGHDRVKYCYFSKSNSIK